MIGRPQQSEAAEYYWKYINCVVGDDPLAAMESQLDEVAAVLGAISEDRSLYSYAPGKWTIRQVLNHVTDTERAFAFRALWFARGFDVPLPSYDQEIAAIGADANSIPWSDHLAEFRDVRKASVALYRNLPASALSRSGIASDNRFTVRAIAYIIAGHLSYHIGIVRERYLQATASGA
jgi:hypothetical protein